MRITTVAAAVLLSAPVEITAQTTFKLAFFNIQSGKGEPALPGRASTFVDTANCTDRSQPMNAWGMGIVQRELTARVRNDPLVVALGLAEAWGCGSPEAVRDVLGWKTVSARRNGIALVARFGFAGEQVWEQLDTSLNDNPSDTMWVLRAPVCLDAACSSSLMTATTHWFASHQSPYAAITYDRQAEQTIAFLGEVAEPHVLIGDLNVWEAREPVVCGQTPSTAGLSRLRDAGYIDAWPAVHGTLEGFTGMTNRRGCGTPEGYSWKRIDYAWSSPGFLPVGMTRFALVPGGEEAPSDHYGIIAEYERPRSIPPGAPLSNGRFGPGDIVLYASQAIRLAGNWRLVEDATAATGRAAENPDLGAPKITTALAAPADFVELTFSVDRAGPYRVWIRGKAARNSWTNDSVFLQFSGTVSAGGTPVWRIGTTSATWAAVEDCSGCGLSGWGWSDNGYGAAGPLVYFAATGTQTLRIQTREDGITIDQVVLSPELYLTASPGSLKDDVTIMPPEPPIEIVRHVSDATMVAGDWLWTPDSSAAGGIALHNPDRGTAKLPAASASPSTYFEVTFNAVPGRPYRVWLRGRAERDHYSNDSVFLQFSGTVTSNGAATWRIGSSSATWSSIEDCSGCGLSGWGWQDNGYGANVLGPVVYFETAGPHTLRIQQREDGITLDQVVLSGERYLTVRPGTTKDDATVLPRR